MSKHKQHGVAMENIVYTNTEAETLITTELPIINEAIKTNAIDLSEQEIPKQHDSLKGYGLFVQSKFQSLLEKVHKQLGAKRSLLKIQTATTNYEKEVKQIQDRNDAIEEDLRLLNKQQKNQNPNALSDIRNYHVALCLLVLLSMSEVVINYKIFLPISSNSLTALIGATGIAISLFIVCHVFKDILIVCSSKTTKWFVGSSIIVFIIVLLFSFAELRLSYHAELDSVVTQHVSSWNLIAINLTLFLSGIALTMIYKPSKKVIAQYKDYKKVKKEMHLKEKQYQIHEKTLAVLTNKHNEFLDQQEGIFYMAHHYEQVICGEYLQAFSVWSNENLIARKDKIRPKAFSETPPPLTTYFDNIQCLTQRKQQES